MKHPPDRGPNPVPGTGRPSAYVVQAWVSDQLKDKIQRLGAPPTAEKADRQIRAPEPELEAAPDHANEPSRGHEITGAGDRLAEAPARRADERAQAARSVDCECQAAAGAPCGPSGDHLARYLRAGQSGALTRESLKEVIADLDVIAPRVLIQPPGERAAWTEAATTAGQIGHPGGRRDEQGPGRFPRP